MESPNFDLALIYNTGGAFEKVASSAQGQVSRPGLDDYAVHIVYGDDVPEQVDLEKVAQAHEFLLDADRTGRAQAQMQFSELEARYLSGDAEAGAAMRAMFDGSGDDDLDKVASSIRAELERRAAEAGLAKQAGVGSFLAGKIDDVAGNITRRVTKANAAGIKAAKTPVPMQGPVQQGRGPLRGVRKTKGEQARERLKALGGEFKKELIGTGVAAGTGGAALAGGGYLAGRSKGKKTTVVYR